MAEIFLQAETLWQREIVRFIRQPIRVMSAIATPLVFWLLLGAGLQASFKPSGMPAGIDYVQYFYPGVIVLMLLFTAIFATASTVDDRRQGFLQGVLVAPISRATIVLAMAWRTESTQGFHAFMNMLLLPIWMLSGAVFPVAGAPGWFQWTTRLNPLTYAVDALRQGLYLAEPASSGATMPMASAVAVAIAFAAFAFLLATRVARTASTV